MLGGEQRHRRCEMDLQDTQQKDAAELKSLPNRNIQTPHHWKRQKKDEEVENQIANSIPSEKCDQVHAVSGDLVIPISCKGGAAEKSKDSTSNPKAPNNEASPPKQIAKDLNHSKYAIVQKQKGSLGQNCV